MRNFTRCVVAASFALAVAALASSIFAPLRAQAQAPAPAAGQPQAAEPQANFRVTVDLITTDMIARDSKSDQFIADLKPEEIELYEDGVKQQIVSLTLTHGGRVYNQLAPPAAPPQEGIILPRNRPTNDAAGRIFLIFIDDL